MYYRSVFRERLIELIENKQVGQKELAKDTGITEATISRYITGKMRPTMKNAQLLAQYFGVSLDYLSGNNANQKQYHIDDETVELAQELMNESTRVKKLLSASRKLSSEDLDALIAIVNSMGQKID